MNIRGKGSTILYICGFLILHFGNISTKEHDGAIRNSKAFSLFSVVTFKNEECTSESTYNGGAVKGTCYSSTECSDKKGTTSGNCAAGFGVCCIFVSNIGTATISENRTYLQSLLYPDIETSTTAITYTVNKMQSDICQLRLDFENFAIAGPAVTDELDPVATDGTTLLGTNCGDQMLVTLSSNQLIPIICGTMSGSHLYVDMGFLATDTATIALTFAGTPMTAATAFRSWRIMTSQIPCWAPYRAPDGCHQYFYGSAFGKLWSPNFRTHPKTTTTSAVNSAAQSNAPNYAVNLMGIDLKMCIRREKGMCCTLFQVCNTDPDDVQLTQAIGGDTAAVDGGQGWVDPGFSFQVDCWSIASVANVATDASIINNGYNVGLADEDCTADYVEIPESTTGIKDFGSAAQTNSRYCCHRMGSVPGATTGSGTAGGLTHAPIWDCTEPFEVLYHTDMLTDQMLQATVANDGITLISRGLCLIYKQEGC